MSAIPYLYIPDHSPASPVVQSGGRNVQFVWDAKLRVHVKRFDSIAQFNREAREIIQEEGMWKIFPGIEEPQPPVVFTLTPEIAERYRQVVGAALKQDFTGQPVTVRTIQDERDFGTTIGVGFAVEVGREFARQAVLLPADLGEEQKAEIFRALTAYFENPDERLVIGDSLLTDNELPLLRRDDGTVGIFSFPPAADRLKTKDTVPSATIAKAAKLLKPPAKKKTAAGKKKARKR